jgi:ParB family chromosome partitioning protein
MEEGRIMTIDLFDPPAIVRPAEDLAADEAALRSERDAVHQHGNDQVTHAQKAGEILARWHDRLKAEHRWVEWLKKMGIPRRTATNWLTIYQTYPKWATVAHLGVRGVLDWLATGKTGEEDEDGEEKAKPVHVAQATGQPEWYTPPEYIEAAREVLGGIDLDPASSAIAQQTVQAERFYTAEDDGLSQDWRGRVWLNPPYNVDLVGRFVAKLCAHVQAGDVPAAVLLTNNATETRWFQEAYRVCRAKCFPQGRIRFLNEHGEPVGAPLQGQSILYFGDRPEAFCEAFQRFGVCHLVSAPVAQALPDAGRPDPPLFANVHADPPQSPADQRQETLEQRRQERRAQAARDGQSASLPPGLEIWTGDFRQEMGRIAADSVSLIFTDPPYDAAAVPLYGDLGEQAARVLVPGGSLVTYVGHWALPEILSLVTRHLRYWWILSLDHAGGSACLQGKRVLVGWKPLVWFVKGTRGVWGEYLIDRVNSKPPTKELHDWEQGEQEAEYLIERLTRPGDLVLDPLCGSGTALAAAHRLGRPGIGIELDPDRADVARGRLLLSGS